MRKTPQIPRDVFFGQALEQPAAAAPAAPPPAPAGEKLQVTIYLSGPAVKRLEALRFHLLNDYNVKVSKSAIAEYALTRVGDDLEAMASFFAMGES